MKFSWKLLAFVTGLCVFSSVMAQDAYQLSAWQKFKAALKIGTHGMGAEEYAEYERRKEAMKATMTAEQYAQQKGALKEGLIQQTHGWYSEIKQQREVEKAKAKQEKEMTKQKEKEAKLAKDLEKQKAKEVKELEKKSESLDKKINDLQKKAKTGQLTAAEKATLSTSMQERARIQDARIEAKPEEFKKMRDVLTAKKEALKAEIATLEKKGWSISPEKKENLLKLEDQIDQTMTLQQKRDAAYKEAELHTQQRIKEEIGSAERKGVSPEKIEKMKKEFVAHEQFMKNQADSVFKQKYGITQLPAIRQEASGAVIKEQTSTVGAGTAPLFKNIEHISEEYLTWTTQSSAQTGTQPPTADIGPKGVLEKKQQLSEQPSTWKASEKPSGKQTGTYIGQQRTTTSSTWKPAEKPSSKPAGTFVGQQRVTTPYKSFDDPGAREAVIAAQERVYKGLQEQAKFQRPVAEPVAQPAAPVEQKPAQSLVPPPQMDDPGARDIQYQEKLREILKSK